MHRNLCVTNSLPKRGGIVPRELNIVEQKIAELWMNDAFREQMIAEAANDHEYEEETKDE